MLKERVITALVLITGLLAALYWCNAFQLSLLSIGILSYAAWEWGNLSSLSGYILKLAFVAVLAGSLWLLGLCLGFPGEIDSTLVINISALALVGWLFALWLICQYPGKAILWQSTLIKLILGLGVLCSTWVALISLLYSSQGKLALLLVIIVVAVADIGAYFSGKLLGKHKLAPNVSPGKTWEGLFGGLTANLLLLSGVIYWFEFDRSYWLWLVALFLVPALLSVVGDLFESILKRVRGVKDSGKILPGHGGILDRIDGLLAALPGFSMIYHISGLQF